jgi:ABC-type nitrate/sulfonate/bicarbonate transport system substrate-binding protein
VGLCSLTLLLGTGLAACSSSPSSGGGTSAPTLAPVSVALDFIPNADNEGVFVAEKLGYFKDEGLDVTVIPYGETPPDTLVATGKVNFAIAATEADALFDFSSGDQVRSVFAVLQHDPNYYGFLASRKDITSPKSFCNMTYGGFGYASDPPVIHEMIHNAGGSLTCPVKIVTLGSSAYQAVDSGKVDFSDFFFSDIIQAEVQEHAHLKWFRPTNYGEPDQYAALFLGNDAWLSGHPTQAGEFVKAIQRAYEYILKNPTQGAQIEADLNPSAVDLPAAIESSQAMAKQFLLSPTGMVGVQTAAMWDGYGSFLYKAGVLTDSAGHKLSSEPNWASYFTNQYLAPG